MKMRKRINSEKKIEEDYFEFRLKTFDKITYLLFRIPKRPVN